MEKQTNLLLVGPPLLLLPSEAPFPPWSVSALLLLPLLLPPPLLLLVENAHLLLLPPLPPPPLALCATLSSEVRCRHCQVIPCSL